MRRSGYRVASRRALLAGAALLAAPARAQSWPDHPIRLVVPFAPGGNVDKIARLLAPIWSERLRQPCVVENRAGAGGSLAAGLVAQARPDGYTLLVGSDGALLLDPKAADGLQDPLKLFAPSGLMSRSHSAVMVPPRGPATLAEFIARAKARPGQLSAGHPGVGTSGQVALHQLSRLAGIELVEVAYRGGGEALADVMAGNIDSLFTELSTLLPLAQPGGGRILAIAAAQRVGVAAAVPSFTELGFPGLVEGAFVGLVAPLGTPQPVLEALARTLAASVTAPGMAEEYARLAIEPPTPEQATPAGLRAFLIQRLARARGG
jgi:tripartite-type tricarboxylate transporter receptor subunit TctC